MEVECSEEFLCCSLPHETAAERLRSAALNGVSGIDYGRDGGMHRRKEGARERKGKGWAPGSESTGEKSLGSAN